MLGRIMLTVLLAMPTGLLAIETIGSKVPSQQYFGQELITSWVKTRIEDDQSLACSVIRKALVDFPDETTEVVIAAMQAGALTEDIACQCDRDIPARIIPDLVSAAISQNADAQILLGRCMAGLPMDQVLNVLMSAMQGTDPTKIEGLIAIALETFRENGIDGSTILVDSLVQGEFLTFDGMPDGCDADCLRPMAETLVNYLSEQTDPTVSLISEPDDFDKEEDIEPPFSDS